MNQALYAHMNNKRKMKKKKKVPTYQVWGPEFKSQYWKKNSDHTYYNITLVYTENINYVDFNDMMFRDEVCIILVQFFKNML
jgi:hypothetical protein